MIRFTQKTDYFKMLDGLFLEHFGVSEFEIRSPSRKYPLVAYRHLYCLAMREAGFTLKEIGKEINRDHSTIINSIEKARDFIYLLKFSKTELMKFRKIQDEMPGL